MSSYIISQDPRTIFVRSLYDFDSDDVDDLPFLCGTIIRVTLQGEDSHLAKITSHDEPNWYVYVYHVDEMNDIFII